MKQINPDEPIQHEFEPPYAVPQFRRTRIERRREPLLRPREDGMDQPRMPLAGLAGCRNHAGHLNPKREVLPEHVAHAGGHGDTPRCRLLLQLLVISRIDAAVNESSQRAHCRSSVDEPAMLNTPRSSGSVILRPVAPEALSAPVSSAPVWGASTAQAPLREGPEEH